MMTLVSAGRILLWQEKSWIGSLTYIWKGLMKVIDYFKSVLAK